MTVSTTSIKNSYSGNGSTTAFAYTFKAFASSEIKVFIRTDSTGAEAQRSEGSGSTNYSVSGVGNAGGGTVTFVTAPASGETVVIRRQTAQTQGTDYVENDPFPAEDHETALDKLTHIVQEVQEEVDRSFKVSKTNSITTPEFVDDASTRADKLLGFSSDGNTLEATTGRVNTVSVSNVAVDGSGNSQSATVSFNSTSGALALGVPVGSTGATGSTGSQGPDGVGGLPYTFSTTTSDADPGAGQIRLNNGTLGSVSEIYIDDSTSASGNPDVSAFILTWDDSTQTSDRGQVTITKKSAQQNFATYKISGTSTDASGYVKLAVTHVVSNGSFSNSDEVLVSFVRTGNAGSLADPMTTRGDMIVRDSSNATARLAIGSANTVLKSDGTDASWGYTVGTSANNLVQLNGSAALPAVSGANLTNLPIPAGSGVVTATASGSITAGKCVILNANGTVSEIAATSISHAVGSDYTQSGETTAELNQLVYDTTDNHFIWGGKNTISGSTAGRVYALDMNSSLAISEAAPPAAAGGVDAACWSATYDETLGRAIFHGSNSSNYVRAHTVNVVSGAMKVSPSINWKNANHPYGFTRGFDADELMVAYQNAATTLRMAFVDITKGSDASGDSFSGFTSEIDPDELDATSTSNAHYSQIVPFTSVNKFLIGHFGNLSGNRSFEFAIGSVGGSSGGSRTFTQDMKGIFTSTGVSTTAVAASVDPVGFVSAGRVEYDSTKDRAFAFDSEFLYSISVDSSGVASMSPLERIQANANTANFFAMKSIPNSDHLVCFFASQANSNRSTYRVVTFNKGATAAADTFTVGSEVEINTNAVALQYTPIAYSPDVDAFMVKEYRSGSAQPFYGVRVARTTTNVKSSGTDARYLGVAKSSVSDGQSVEIAVTGSVATMAAGGMSIGTTFFVQNDGTVGTTDRNFGTAGVAVSATQLLLE